MPPTITAPQAEPTPRIRYEGHAGVSLTRTSCTFLEGTVDVMLPALFFFKGNPRVANGKVYVATWSNQLAVYGLLLSYTVSPTSLAFGSQMINLASAPKSFTVTNTGTV